LRSAFIYSLCLHLLAAGLLAAARSGSPGMPPVPVVEWVELAPEAEAPSPANALRPKAAKAPAPSVQPRPEAGMPREFTDS